MYNKNNKSTVLEFEEKLIWVDRYIDNADRLEKYLDESAYELRCERYGNAINCCKEVIQKYKELTKVYQKTHKNNLAKTYCSLFECYRTLAELEIEYNINKRNVSSVDILENVINNFIKSLEACKDYFRDFQGAFWRNKLNFKNKVNKKFVSNIHWINAFFVNYINPVKETGKLREIEDTDWELLESKSLIDEKNTIKEQLLEFIENCIDEYKKFKTSLKMPNVNGYDTISDSLCSAYDDMLNDKKTPVNEMDICGGGNGYCGPFFEGTCVLDTQDSKDESMSDVFSNDGGNVELEKKDEKFFGGKQSNFYRKEGADFAAFFNSANYDSDDDTLPKEYWRGFKFDDFSYEEKEVKLCDCDTLHKEGFYDFGHEKAKDLSMTDALNNVDKVEDENQKTLPEFDVSRFLI